MREYQKFVNVRLGVESGHLHLPRYHYLGLSI